MAAGGVRLQVEVEKFKFMNEVLEDRLREKDVMIERLMVQIEHLQDALVAKEAPEAWGEMKANEREVALTEDQVETRKRTAQEAKILEQYAREIERPTMFNDPDELNSLMTPILMAKTEPGSVHGNEES